MRYVLLILGLLAAGIAFQFYTPSTSIRYRMIVDVEVDGKVRTGSSVIEVTYYFGKSHTGARWVSQFRGIAPIIDIAPYGTLVAALTYDNSDLYRRHRPEMSARLKRYQIVSEVVRAESPPLVAFNLTPEDIYKAKGSAELNPHTPAFIWIRPPGDDWQNARQLLPELFGQLISPSVRVLKITIERADGAPVLVQVPNPPTWLLKLREFGKHDRSAVAREEPFSFSSSAIETKFETPYASGEILQ